MVIEFKYSVAQDLMYHILAHMNVENASNLYSQSYIDNVNKIKNGRYDSIAEAVSHLSNYYNKNFERLAVINFLPIKCPSVQALIGVNESYCGFTEIDKKEFVFPLNQLLKSELQFYEDYWSKLYDTTSICRKAFESWLKNEMGKYRALFSYFNKVAVVGMSYSMTSNGRGCGDTSSFNAVVPFAYDEREYKSTFYQILHEYTHQFTDNLIGEYIRMDDGSHDISERAVILFDYYLINKLSKEDTDSYLKWVSSLSNVGDYDEKLFLLVFKISDEINVKLLDLVEKIKKDRNSETLHERPSEEIDDSL